MDPRIILDYRVREEHEAGRPQGFGTLRRATPSGFYPQAWERAQQPIVSRTTLWACLLMLGVLMLKVGFLIGRSPSDASKVKGKQKVLAQRAFQEGSPSSYSTLKDPFLAESDTSSFADGESALSKAGQKGKDDDAEGVGSKDEESSSVQDDGSLLRAFAPTFTSLNEKFSNPKSEAEEWANKTVDLAKFLETMASREAAEEFENLVFKTLPPEKSLELNTMVINTTVMDIRKQKLAKLACDSFLRRRRRDEKLATVLIMERYLKALEKREAGGETPPYMDQMLAKFHPKIDILKEREVLARERRDYELALVKERVALDELSLFWAELAAHVAAMEMFRHVDQLESRWRKESSALSDSGRAVCAGDMQTHMKASTKLVPISADVTLVKGRVFGAEGSVFSRVVKLSSIIDLRKRINRLFYVAHDPKCEGRDESEVLGARSEAYKLTQRVEALQQELFRDMEAAGRSMPLLEAWFALIL